MREVRTVGLYFGMPPSRPLRPSAFRRAHAARIAALRTSWESGLTVGCDCSWKVAEPGGRRGVTGSLSPNCGMLIGSTGSDLKGRGPLD